MSKKSPAPPLPDGSRNLNPSDITFWELVREDFVTNDSEWSHQGFWAIFWHRFGNARMSQPRVIRAPMTLIYMVMRKMCQIVCGIKLDYTVQLGRRVKLEHFGGMVLGARSIGNDVVIRQNTTFGIKSPADVNAKPTIGNRVNIGAGAVIVGDIHIGDGAQIGANCVVWFDVPAMATVRPQRPEVILR